MRGHLIYPTYEAVLADIAEARTRRDWFGGANGYMDECDEWRNTGGWEFTRHTGWPDVGLKLTISPIYPVAKKEQPFFKKRRPKGYRFRLSLEGRGVRGGFTYEPFKGGEVKRFDDVFEKVHQWLNDWWIKDELKYWMQSLYAPEHATCVYYDHGDGYVPFCTIFGRDMDLFRLRDWGIPLGCYRTVSAGGYLRNTEVSTWSTGGGPVSDSDHGTVVHWWCRDAVVGQPRKRL